MSVEIKDDPLSTVKRPEHPYVPKRQTSESHKWSQKHHHSQHHHAQSHHSQSHHSQHQHKQKHSYKRHRYSRRKTDHKLSDHDTLTHTHTHTHTHAPKNSHNMRDTHTPKNSHNPKQDKSYLLNHLDTFFGQRNGVSANPKVDTNFTLETLTYMTSRRRADELTVKIEQAVGQPISQLVDKTTKKIIVVETCSGIGGNTLSFLDSERIVKVYCHEIDPGRRQMLSNNINMYGFDQDSYVLGGKFVGIPLEALVYAKTNDCTIVVNFDPPWLPEGISGEDYVRGDYVSSGLQISGISLEKWLHQPYFNRAKVVMFRLPPQYEFSFDDCPFGYTMTEELLGYGGKMKLVTMTSRS